VRFDPLAATEKTGRLPWWRASSALKKDELGPKRGAAKYDGTLGRHNRILANDELKIVKARALRTTCRLRACKAWLVKQ
jgi:hypothetical protein